jgi:hypothetical protein
MAVNETLEVAVEEVNEIISKTGFVVEPSLLFYVYSLALDPLAKLIFRYMLVQYASVA